MQALCIAFSQFLNILWHFCLLLCFLFFKEESIKQNGLRMLYSPRNRFRRCSNRLSANNVRVLRVQHTLVSGTSLHTARGTSFSTTSTKEYFEEEETPEDVEAVSQEGTTVNAAH